MSSEKRGTIQFGQRSLGPGLELHNGGLVVRQSQDEHAFALAAQYYDDVDVRRESNSQSPGPEGSLHSR